MSSESNIHSELSIVPPPNIPPLPGHVRLNFMAVKGESFSGVAHEADFVVLGGKNFL
jgi:hypothetical protein